MSAGMVENNSSDSIHAKDPQRVQKQTSSDPSSTVHTLLVQLNMEERSGGTWERCHSTRKQPEVFMNIQAQRSTDKLFKREQKGAVCVSVRELD